MDFFSRLPATIRIQILIDLGSPACIRRLIKASPTMLQQYTVHRHVVVREVLSELTSLDQTGGLLQDAMALLYLADLEPIRYPRQKWLYIFMHTVDLRRNKQEYDLFFHYEKQNFPNPLESSDKPTQLRVYQLISQIIICIEDYRRKEDCSEAQRLSYPFGDPSLKHGRSWSSNEYQMRLKPTTEWSVNNTSARSNKPGSKPQLDHDRIPFSSLKSSERCLFLRVFLKYQFFSSLKLLYDPHPYRGYFTLYPFYRFLSSQERDAIVLVHRYHKRLWSKIRLGTDNSKPYAGLQRLRAVVQIPTYPSRVSLPEQS
ncbi:uncharacterized protein FTJAE_5931 [Fusarium tjaetaba]|uniref:Uncharacterized protein n=1 Tax=Fusarium tjaetaba TaxID=1567544 RepID=A0A8H5RPH7_9HYPO|nr:uncharacterized protein FTJAE_5931 [Fusarium tjaetaba]KAF5636735.1 hypothetical protein FTJAE_5931 [Fusarium tjaetaba]